LEVISTFSDGSDQWPELGELEPYGVTVDSWDFTVADNTARIVVGLN
jgi:hypothetical protein